ncbi:hypothetical protein GOBAR_DD27895 [Gossypium barbadense]|nr:hypothetical protein GOBAR_DD27895 [Gossypium barbadense]
MICENTKEVGGNSKARRKEKVGEVWSVRPGIGKSYDVPIYRLMIEQHTREGVEVVHGMTERGRFQMDWEIKHQKFVALWNDRLRRIPHMVMATDPQPSSDPNLTGGDYFPSFAGGEYTYEFELFRSYPPQCGMPGPSDPYPQHHGTYSGSKSDRRPPNRYTPRRTPSNHQF